MQLIPSVLAAIVLDAALAAQVKMNLPIVNKVIAPDGYSRSATLAGGTFPGPLIQGDPTSTFQINVQNLLHDKSMHLATTIHWHGLHQKNTSWADGAAFVSQCPIVPNQNFTYSFGAQGQAGTFSYHSGYATQRCDGLRGPLVIYDPNDPYKSLYDVDNSSTVITLADWYHEPSLLDLPYAYPDATLVNGLGRAWENTTATDLAVVSVERGQRYRLRIVSLSCQPAFTFSIDNHTFTVIEADGVLHQKYSIDSVTIYPGQRYSAILNAHLPVDNYWIRVLPVADGLTFPSGVYAGDGNAAILRYLGAPIWHPITRSTVRHALDESQLIPYANAAPPGSPSVIAPDVYSLDLDFTLDRTNFVYYMNGFVDALPSVPVLAQILSGAGSVHDLLPTSQIISLPRNTVVQLSFPGGDTAPDTRHSIHMHGHSFSVVRSAGQQTYNFVNPPQRDVVNTGQSGDVTTIRFVTDNSGPWVLYDHVAWHSIAGFMVVFVEDTPANIKSSTAPSSQWNNLCKAWNTFNATGGR